MIVRRALTALGWKRIKRQVRMRAVGTGPDGKGLRLKVMSPGGREHDIYMREGDIFTLDLDLTLRAK